MGKNRNESQFDDYRDWQWIKHLILRNYAHLWARILGSTYRHIVAVDACAGAGAYTDPDTGEMISEGSPVIFGRAAKTYTEERGPGKSMRVICCERNRNNYRLLTEAVQPFQPHVRTLQGGFWRHVPAIAKELGDSPAMILLDPIGVATIPSDVWRPFLERKAKTDLFVVLHFAGVHRTGGWLLSNGEANPTIAPARRGAATHDRVFNGREWRDIAVDPALKGEEHREKRERRYVELFFENVIGDRHRWKCYCEVRARYQGPIKYWIVHASDDLKPYTLMNDEIVNVTEILLRREYRDEGTLAGFEQAELEAQRAHVESQMKDAVLECVRATPGGALPYGAIGERLLARFFGRAKSNVPWRVVKQLCKDDELIREKTKGAASDPLEMISLPTPPIPPQREGGDIIPIRRVA